MRRKALLIPLAFVLLRAPETVYRVLEYWDAFRSGDIHTYDPTLHEHPLGIALNAMQVRPG